MKKLVVLAVFGLLTISTFAQKLGHINAQEILSLILWFDLNLKLGDGSVLLHKLCKEQPITSLWWVSDLKKTLRTKEGHLE